MKVGDRVIVKDNLESELRRLTFDEYTCENMAEHFVGTEQEIFSLDELKNQLKQDINFVYENYVYKTVKSMVK